MSISLTKRVIGSLSWLAVAQVAQRATTLVVTALLARQLFPQDFGLVALTLLTVNLLSYFQDMGLSVALVQRTKLESSHLTTAFFLNLSAGIVLAGAGILLSPVVAKLFREPRLSTILMVTICTLPINGCGWTSYALLQRRFAFKQIGIIEWLAILISGAAAVALALSGAGVWSLVGQAVTASLVSSSGRLIAARWWPRFVFSLERARELLSFSFGAFGYYVVNQGMRNIDTAIVGGVLGTTALGYYSLAYNLVLMPGLTVCSLIGRVMFPVLSSVQNDLIRFRRAYLKMARTITLITFPLVIGLGAIAPLFVLTIYGERWTPAAPLVQILIVVGFFESMSFWGAAAWALGRTQTTMWLAIVALITMTISFIIGVRWGLAGIAWTYVIISPIVYVLPHLWTNHLIVLRFGSLLRAIGLPFCAAAIMGLVVLIVKLNGFEFSSWRWANLIGFVSLGGAAYVIVLAFMAIPHRQHHSIISWLTGPGDSEGQPEGVRT